MILEISDFGRIQLADLLHQLDAKVAVEIGVAAGWYSEVLMKANPQMKLYGVDPWIRYEGYTDYMLAKTFQNLEEQAHQRLDKFPNYTFLKEFSMDALKRFENNSLDFVYLDGNHSDPYISEDIREWFKKIKPGGILAGHDYVRTAPARGRERINNTREATNKFTQENNLILFILGSSAVREGEVRDNVRSWMVKK